jgi:hypothetical protein
VVFHEDPGETHYQAIVSKWSPDEDGGGIRIDDVAFLQLPSPRKPLPEGVQALKLGSTHVCQGHPMRTAGYASQPGGYEYAWAEGHIGGVVPHPDKSPMLQIDARPIYEGMSGAPVLDLETNRVVGMVSKFVEGEPLEWATTAETLKAISEGILALHPGTPNLTGGPDFSCSLNILLMLPICTVLLTNGSHVVYYCQCN